MGQRHQRGRADLAVAVAPSGLALLEVPDQPVDRERADPGDDEADDGERIAGAMTLLRIPWKWVKSKHTAVTTTRIRMSMPVDCPRTSALV
jgi:hypothetical protein